MKTLTEFSTLTLRRAAAARAAAGGATVSVPAAELDAAMDASDDASGDGAAAPAEGGEPAAEAPDAAAPQAGDGSGGGEAAEAKPDPVVEAVAAALGVQADRAARMLEALDIVGNRIDEVRLVRVYQGEAGPPARWRSHR